MECPGHCTDCRTERDEFGGVCPECWLAGAPNPEGDGQVPNITPDAAGLADWSAKDITYYLETGFLPDFDAVGGSMVPVQENLARLSPEDRAAIVTYLLAIPALPKVQWQAKFLGLSVLSVLNRLTATGYCLAGTIAGESARSTPATTGSWSELRQTSSA